ncbi:hypothetical protein HDV05_005680 [Chytridiales sp. JEL 0842]|nr:hypothetical protein HDV05_005680 [Chytridiales sp. JEL 0842]
MPYQPYSPQAPGLYVNYSGMASTAVPQGQSPQQQQQPQGLHQLQPLPQGLQLQQQQLQQQQQQQQHPSSQNVIAISASLPVVPSPTASTAAPLAQLPQQPNPIASTSKREAPVSDTPTKPKKPKPEERKGRHRTKPLTGMQERIDKAVFTRLHLMNRIYVSSMHQQFHVLGSNPPGVHTVDIAEIPKCSCIEYEKLKGICQHSLFVWVKVLRVPTDDIAIYQRALLSVELIRAFNCGLQHDPSAPLKHPVSPSSTPLPPRPPNTHLCPICFDSFPPAPHPDSESVSCRYGCGTNIHVSCFEIWKRQKAKRNERVLCACCRCEWDVPMRALSSAQSQQQQQQQQQQQVGGAAGAGAGGWGGLIGATAGETSLVANWMSGQRGGVGGGGAGGYYGV